MEGSMTPVERFYTAIDGLKQTKDIQGYLLASEEVAAARTELIKDIVKNGPVYFRGNIHCIYKRWLWSIDSSKVRGLSA
jgi:hypothetical protein